MLTRFNHFCAVTLILTCMTPLCHAEGLSTQSQSSSTLFDTFVKVESAGNRFKVEASYRVPISLCGAYNFLTHYEGAKYIPGILESNVVARSGNRVQVERLVQEQILLFSFSVRSLIEYAELPYQGLDFHQIKGDTKHYEGTWRLMDEGGTVLFKYQSVIEPNSLIPDFVVRRLIRRSIYQRFAKMAENAFQYGQDHLSECQ